MKVIIPVAGYATRLYPLTKETPKALLEVGGKCMLDHIIDQLQSIDYDEIILISNHKYFNKFQEWAEKKDLPIKVVDDKTNSNEDRLGAIGDLVFGIDKENINDDI